MMLGVSPAEPAVQFPHGLTDKMNSKGLFPIGGEQAFCLFNHDHNSFFAYV